MTVGGIGLEEGEGGVRWKGSHPQEWAGLDWKSRSGLGDRRGLCGQLQMLWPSPRSYELVAIRPEAWAVTWGKSVNEAVE